MKGNKHNNRESNIKFKNRVGVFIDEANLYYSQKSLGWNISFQKLKEYIDAIGKNTVLNIYSGYELENYRQIKLFQKLRNIGYKIIRKKIKFIKDNGKILKKGNLDIELALDAYRYRARYDVFILFSGDSDFMYLLHILKKEGKKIMVFSTRTQIAIEILKSFEFINISNLREYIEK